MRFEDTLENNNLYIKNSPFPVTQEDLKKTFEKFGTITSIKLEEDIQEVKGNKEKNDEKDKNKKFINKGYGYISFEKVESAKNALLSLNGKCIEGFESWTKPLLIDYFVSKDKRQNMIQPGINYYGMQNTPYPPMFQMPISMPNQYKPNMLNKGYNNYRPKYNNGYQHRRRGGNRGGYHKNNNYQKKSNNNNNDKITENNYNKNNPNEKKIFLILKVSID